MTILMLNCEHTENYFIQLNASMSISGGMQEFTEDVLWKTFGLVWGDCPINSEHKFHFKLYSSIMVCSVQDLVF